MKLIPRENITETQSKNLVNILNYDEDLNIYLRPKGTKSSNKILTLEEFNKTNSEWIKKTNSKMFIIVKNDLAIGTISLSHIKEKTARIGYWLASDFWGKGIMSMAFAKLLDIAKANNLRYISSTIDKTNTASLRIWMKYDPIIEEKNTLQNLLKIVL